MEGILQPERGQETWQGKESASAKAGNWQWALTLDKPDCVPGPGPWTFAPTTEYIGATDQC